MNGENNCLEVFDKLRNMILGVGKILGEIGFEF